MRSKYFLVVLVICSLASACRSGQSEESQPAPRPELPQPASKPERRNANDLEADGIRAKIAIPSGIARAEEIFDLALCGGPEPRGTVEVSMPESELSQEALKLDPRLSVSCVGGERDAPRFTKAGRHFVKAGRHWAMPLLIVSVGDASTEFPVSCDGDVLVSVRDFGANGSDLLKATLLNPEGKLAFSGMTALPSGGAAEASVRLEPEAVD